MKICQSCGGSFKESLPKCPYCGSLNPEGAEKEYNKKLNNIRKKLDVVDELAVENFRNEVRLFFKVFIASLAVCAAIAVLFVLARGNRYSNASVFEDRREKTTKAFAELKVLHEKTSRWDVLFDEGKYDLVMEELGKTGFNGLYGWEHYRFFALYSDLSEADESIEKIETGTAVFHYTYSSLLDKLVYLWNALDRTDYNLTTKDRLILETDIKEQRKRALPLLGMSEDEFEKFVSDACSEGYPNYTFISEYAKERWGE